MEIVWGFLFSDSPGRYSTKFEILTFYELSYVHISFIHLSIYFSGPFRTTLFIGALWALYTDFLNVNCICQETLHYINTFVLFCDHAVDLDLLDLRY